MHEGYGSSAAFIRPLFPTMCHCVFEGEREIAVLYPPLLVILHLFFAPLCQGGKESVGMIKRCATQITVNLLCFNVSEGAICIGEPAEFSLRFKQTKELTG